MRQKKQVIRKIAKITTESHKTPLKACKLIVQKNNESQAQIYTYFSWWNKRKDYLTLKNAQFNIKGQGNKRSSERKQLFAKVDELFEYYRYELKIPMRLNDVGDLFIKAAQYLQLPYNNDDAPIQC